MAKSPRNQLITFECEADAAVEAMSLASMPARASLTLLNTTVFGLLHVAGPKDREMWQTGDTLTYRISYLIPWLRRRNSEKVGAGAADVLQAVQERDPEMEDARNLGAYAHFCEVMPEVHRHRLKVEARAGGFRLVHPDQSFATAEAADIIVSELALNHLANNEPRLPDDEVFDLARSAPRLDPVLMDRLIRRREQFYAMQIREAPLVGDREMTEIFGFDRARFAKIQAALFALSDVFSQLALVLWVWSSKSDGAPSSEALEWVTPCWKYEGFLKQASELCGVSTKEIDSFVSHFTLDYNLPPEEARGGDGFTPPFFRLGGSILFSPDLIPRYCQPRNVLTHMAGNEKHRDLFNNLVSGELEPKLVSEVVAALRGFDDLIVKTNHEFTGGEFDVIMCDKAGRNVVICEVKAPLPPQGSRLTKRLAERIQEGLAQIERARKMERSTLNGILKNALGVEVSDARVEYVIMARACFGAIEVWHADADQTPATLPLLRLALKRIRDAEGSPARDLTKTLQSVTKQILSDSNFRWEHAGMPLFGRTIETPQLLYDHKAVDGWMRAAEAARQILTEEGAT